MVEEGEQHAGVRGCEGKLVHLLWPRLCYAAQGLSVGGG